MSNIVGDVGTVVISSAKRISNIFPDVVIQETHTDDLTITSHPVQQGARISDHAYKEPAKLSMLVGWSDAKDTTARTPGGAVINTIADAYSALLKLQSDAKPFDVITNKRAYGNMLIRTLSTVTDEQSLNVLKINVTFQQIVVAKTYAVTTTPLPVAAQAKPQLTTPPANKGTVQPKSVRKPSGATGKW